MIERGRDILRQAESELRSLLAKAASGGDYEAVTRLALLAQKVAELLAEVNGQRRPTNHPPPEVGREADRPVRTGASGSASKRGRPAKAARRAKRGKAAKSRGRLAGTGGYPEFFRQRDELVKVAWSKRARKEYQHKAPWRIASLVARAISKAAEDGALVRADDFMPVGDSDGSEVPSYQAYLCLAWLKYENLVVPHGRQGYAVENPSSLPALAERRWGELPVKRSRA